MLHSKSQEFMFHYCELRSDELQLYKENQVLKKSIVNSNKMHDEVMKHNLYLKIEVLILQAKIAFIKGNVASSLSKCDDALYIAQKWDLTELINIIKKEQENVLDELCKWKNLIETHRPLIERMKDSKVEELISKLFVGQITDL